MTLITQCPHCKTRFRIGAFQLKAARGLARCGACLVVFNAQHHSAKPPVLLQHPIPESEIEPTQIKIPVRSPLPQLPAYRAHSVAVVPPPEDQPPRIRLGFASRDADCSVPEPAPEPLAGFDNPKARKAYQPIPVPSELSEQDAPWQLDRSLGHSEAARSWGLPVLVLSLGILGFSGLYGVLHFQELARLDSVRPVLERFCATLGCRLPAYSDVSRIQSSNLLVQSHPEFQGVLRVEALLYNRAHFSQPYPILELHFNDMNGWRISSRQFKPSEYLGSTEHPKEMPPQVPISIQVDVLDPGEHAVGYSLGLLPPE
ncbi:putative Zn finger-like uncharacterized protein [Azomonas agilis]|uniref:Putative Zn finger-like uncharacterized protein n=1 Tax=Azomonas agilis TaxID=116849 RepID=A0A562J310_9GAMM|nr:DUF3426 domain-containing protein [Azomonas agilis]TWH77512.1 putative Zn finger-like uncharacterized protein [Azomonas agilis]